MWPHWLLTMSDIKTLVEDGREMLDRMDAGQDADEDDIDDNDVDVEEDDDDEPDGLYAKLLKDFTRIDFSQTPGVSVYITDTCYQLYVGEHLFLDYLGNDAREFAASVCAFNQKRAYNGEDYYYVCYDSGFTSTSLKEFSQPNFMRLAKHEYKTGLPDNRLPPVVLLRPTAVIPEGDSYADWTHASDVSSVKKDALDTLIAAAQGYMMEMSIHHVNANEKRQQIQQAINLLRPK